MKTKIIKNTTGNDIFINNTGVVIPANSQYELNPTEWQLWSQAIEFSPDSQLVTLINNEDLIINNGEEDLSVVLGISYIRNIFIPIYIHHEGNLIGTLDDPVQIINITGSANVTDEGSGTRKIDIDSYGTSPENKLITVAFCNQSTTKNKWLGYWGNSFTSDQQPFICPFSLKLVGISYINRNNYSDVDVELYKNGSLYYNWELRDKRKARKSNNLNNITFSSDDYIGIFIRDKGSNAKRVVVTLLLQITDATVGEAGSGTL